MYSQVFTNFTWRKLEVSLTTDRHGFLWVRQVRIQDLLGQCQRTIVK